MTTTDTSSQEPRTGSLWETLRSRLSEHGVYVGFKSLEGLGEELGFGNLEDLTVDFGTSKGGIKVVCVPPDLKSSAEEMKETQRDQVVMVRVDEETRDKLDDWVQTGAVKSRSEAAALFIREGLAVRADELDRLRDALREVEAAKERLQQKAREVFDGAPAAEATD